MMLGWCSQAAPPRHQRMLPCPGKRQKSGEQGGVDMGIDQTHYAITGSLRYIGEHPFEVRGQKSWTIAATWWLGGVWGCLARLRPWLWSAWWLESPENDPKEFERIWNTCSPYFILFHLISTFSFLLVLLLWKLHSTSPFPRAHKQHICPRECPGTRPSCITWSSKSCIGRWTWSRRGFFNDLVA